MIDSAFSVGDWVERLHLDTTSTVIAILSKLDVTLVTPRGTPRVLDEPVFNTVL